MSKAVQMSGVRRPDVIYNHSGFLSRILYVYKEFSRGPDPEPRHPAKVTNVSCLDPPFHSFGHHPQSLSLALENSSTVEFRASPLGSAPSVR